MLNKKDYLSWADTLHPEATRHGTAETGSATTAAHCEWDRWNVVWAEATLIDSSGSENGKSSTKTTRNGETIEVMNPVPIDPETPVVGAFTSGSCIATAGADTSVAAKPYSRANPLELLVGLVFTVSAVTHVWSIELAALMLYYLACVFYWLANQLKQDNFVSLTFFTCFILIAHTIMYADGVFLLLSVLTAELHASLAALMCSLTFGCRRAGEWHQFIRRLCHTTRWAFRGLHAGLEPERKFFWDPSTPNEPNVLSTPEDTDTSVLSDLSEIALN